MTDAIEWRKLGVNRDSRFEPLVSKLCSTKSGVGHKALFGTVKEFMVFAALVGFQLGEFKPLTSKSGTIQILLETYETTKHDAYIYLIALAEKQTLDILKDDELKDAINIFEGYCNAGLLHIDDWVFSNLGESILEETLFKQTLEFLTNHE